MRNFTQIRLDIIKIKDIILKSKSKHFYQMSFEKEVVPNYLLKIEKCVSF